MWSRTADKRGNKNLSSGTEPSYIWMYCRNMDVGSDPEEDMQQEEEEEEEKKGREKRRGRGMVEKKRTRVI